VVIHAISASIYMIVYLAIWHQNKAIIIGLTDVVVLARASHFMMPSPKNKIQGYYKKHQSNLNDQLFAGISFMLLFISPRRIPKAKKLRKVRKEGMMTALAFLKIRSA
jgi:hypothetical protein